MLDLHSWKLTLKTQKGPYKDCSPSKKGGYMGFHVSLGECRVDSECYNCAYCCTHFCEETLFSLFSSPLIQGLAIVGKTPF